MPSVKIPVKRDVVGYAIVLDASTKTARIALLRRYAGLLFYLPEGWRGAKYLFIPAGPPIGVLAGTNKPIYVALQFSRTAVSVPLEVPLILKAYGESTDLSTPHGLQKFLQIVGEKILEKEQAVGELQLFDGVAISIPFEKAAEYLSSWVSTTSKTVFDGLADFWSEIERAAATLRGAGAGEWMRYLMYMILIIGALVLVFMLVGRISVAPHLLLTAVRWLLWL